MDKFALVTGTDHGLGFSFVQKLLEKGYTVFAGCLSKSTNQFREITKEYKDKLHLIQLDISNMESVNIAKEYILGYTNSLDVLINNAGILGDMQATIEDKINYDDVEHIIHVNAIGTLKVTNEMFSLLIKGEDKLIVTISSEAGSVEDCWRNSWFGYCMSKSAINMQSAIIHNQFKKYDGQVLVIHPGWMKTYMRGKLDENADITSDYAAECILRLMENKEQYRSDKVVFLDYKGNKMNW